MVYTIVAMEITRTKKNKRLVRLYLWLSVLLPAFSVFIAIINGRTFLSKNGAELLFGLLLIAVYFGIQYIPATFPIDNKKGRHLVALFLFNVVTVVGFASFNLYSLYTIFFLYGLTNVMILFLYLAYLGAKGFFIESKKKDIFGILTGLIFGAVSIAFVSLPARSIAYVVWQDVVTPAMRDYVFLVYTFVGIVYATIEMGREMKEKDT